MDDAQRPLSHFESVDGIAGQHDVEPGGSGSGLRPDSCQLGLPVITCGADGF